MKEENWFTTCPVCKGVKQKSNPTNGPATDPCQRCGDTGAILTDEGRAFRTALAKLDKVGKAEDEAKQIEERAKMEVEKRASKR